MDFSALTDALASESYDQIANSTTPSCFRLHLRALLFGTTGPMLFFSLATSMLTTYAVRQGWTMDPASQMLTVKKQAVATEQKLDPSKLQRLTEYVFHLEH
ncbi:COP9 signalosome complex subunit [Sesamum angolense]|uniref:COP9 signalosome complex subunit n=1 Tax=Sesamum angolense TaxID=2727404 RepID=A0AAE1WYI9_9LAMI|nr:COP9 signalosome complex subunit [Sesamum angolense]